MTLHLAPSAASSQPSTREAAGFDVLDDVVRQPEAHGVLFVDVAAAADVDGVIGHIARRARQSDRELVVVPSAGVESGFRDAAHRLGLRAIPHEPREAAQVIAVEASQRRALLIVPLIDADAAALLQPTRGARGAASATDRPVSVSLRNGFGADRAPRFAQPGADWDLAVASALAELDMHALVVVLMDAASVRSRGAASTTGAPSAGTEAASQANRRMEWLQTPSGVSATSLVFSVGRQLTNEEARRWWDAFSSVGRAETTGHGLGSLECWARESLTLPQLRDPGAEGAAPWQPSVAARNLLSRLRLSGRSWPEENLLALFDSFRADLASSADAVGQAALEELRSHGAVDQRDGLVCPTSMRGAVSSPGAVPSLGAVSASASGAADYTCVAEALRDVFPEDAWAFVRAAELLTLAGSGAAAEDAMRRALRLAADATSRSVLWERWRVALDVLGEEERAGAGIRSAELALELGDVEVALQWAERASGTQPHPQSALVLGRAALARGDLVSARAALTRARELADAPDLRAAVVVELAEVSYAAGDVEAADTLAREALQSQVPSVRLAARNLIGKLLLARAEWVLADAHFAADACEAAFCGERVAELRARVNRAIALLSRGSPDEARPILTDVLRDAEQAGELRAVGFALSNLAVLAIERHDYAEALELSERAISVRRRLGERLGFARDVTNLVELRLRLGLVDAAEQALAFGRQALGPGAPASRLAELGLAAARVHVARGRTLEAERELRGAMRTATQASDGDKLCECHRLAVRVALEEGVVHRAQLDLERAEALSTSPFAAAEAKLLRGLVLRASGEPDLALCLDAVVDARECGDEELAREAHVLVAEIALSAQVAVGRSSTSPAGFALEHIRAAVALRDEVASGLGETLASVYLARPDLRGLAQLEASMVDAEPDAPSAPGSRRSPRSLLPAKPREYVGRHVLVRKLLSAVERIGQTDATVLIHGESGSGKELIAEALHGASDRVSGPLVKVNCGALVETLLLSELFGHEKGAFTGANSRKRGRFERAHGGTLFLDEIGDISGRTQVALLRALEGRSIERVGGSAPIPIDVRIVCATHRDLRRMVELGEFREDLYYRLSGITVQVPALRERVSDLPALCGALLENVAQERSEPTKRVDAAALELLSRHRWPGNVRELENALRVASLFAEGSHICCEDFTQHVEALARVAATMAERRVDSSGGVDSSRGDDSNRAELGRADPGQATSAAVRPAVPLASADADLTVDAYQQIREQGVSLSDLKRQIERDCIALALDETSGNITRAAAVLGMKRPRLSQLVKQHGLATAPDSSSNSDTSSGSDTSGSFDTSRQEDAATGAVSVSTLGARRDASREDKS